MDLTGTRLTVLTEGDAERGLGHVTRCLAHAEVWHHAGAEIHWHLDGDDRARILILDTLPDLADRLTMGPWQADEAGLADSAPADVLLVDSYGLTDRLAHSLSQRAQQVVFIDDQQALAYPPSLVLHPAPDPAPRQRDEAQWLTGPKWQALRRPFQEAPEPEPARPGVRRILLLMGGTDSTGRGPTVADHLGHLLPEAEIRVVGGHTAAVVSTRWRALGPLSAEALAEEMKAADLAVSAAGQTVFELAALGVPTVMLGVAENQRPSLEYWPGRIGFRNAGMVDSPEFEARLTRAIAAMAPPQTRNDVAHRAWSLVDGLGAIRLIHALGRGE